MNIHHDVSPDFTGYVSCIQFGRETNDLGYKIASYTSENRTHNDPIHGRKRRPLSQRAMYFTPRPDARKLRLLTAVSVVGHIFLKSPFLSPLGLK